MKELFNLAQKVAIVTGGNGGIGNGIARGFASMGANVAIGTGGSGVWEVQPYRALAAGVFYFFLMAMAKFIIVLKVNSAAGARTHA